MILEIINELQLDVSLQKIKARSTDNYNNRVHRVNNLTKKAHDIFFDLSLVY
jgi:predicted AAA+ superfamily ATPase